MYSAIILAAGLGRKAWPYGEYRQKCTIPIANVPIVRRLAKSLIDIGVNQIIVVVGHHAQQVRGAVADLPGIEFVTQASDQGTAISALSAAEKVINKRYLIVYGDVVTPVENFRDLVQRFEESGAVAAAMLQSIGHEDPSNWICGGIDGDLLSGTEGHPRGSAYRLCGVYAVRSDMTSYLLRNPGIATRVPVGGMPPPEAEISSSFQVMIDDGQQVLAVETNQFFVDVDKPWHILEANRLVIDYLMSKVEDHQIDCSASISDAAEIQGKIVLGKNSVIGPRVVIKNGLIAGANNNITNGAILGGHVLVGNHCRISDYCDIGNSTVGNHCVIGHGAEMSGVMFDKVYLYHYCEMSGVFGTATDIGAATVCGTLRFDDRDTAHQINGRYEVPTVGANATYMGDYCRTGVNAMIMPGTKIGSYSVVGPGVILNEDVPSKTMIMVKQELVKKTWGPERYGW